MHIIKRALHCVVVVEHHPRQLIVGDLNHLRPLRQSGIDGALAAEGNLVVEEGVVTVVVERVEAGTGVARSVEPGEGVAVEGRPDLHAVDVRRDRHGLLVDTMAAGRPRRVVGRLEVAAALVHRFAGHRAEAVVGGGVVAVVLSPVHRFGVDVVDEDDRGFLAHREVEHRTRDRADQFRVVAVGLPPFPGEAAVVESSR